MLRIYVAVLKLALAGGSVMAYAVLTTLPEMGNLPITSNNQVSAICAHIFFIGMFVLFGFVATFLPLPKKGL